MRKTWIRTGKNVRNVRNVRNAGSPTGNTDVTDVTDVLSKVFEEDSTPLFCKQGGDV